VKQMLLNILRQVHIIFRRSALPERVAIYYHELRPEQLDHFKQGIARLLDEGYEVVNAQQYVADNGPEKRLFISFDDNFRDWHSALGVMDELGVHCTFYVTSGVFADRSTIAEQKTFTNRIQQSDNHETLTVGQLREIADRGHTIGCHTHTHPLLSEMPEERWDREIAHSKDVLERLIDAEVNDFAFPFGMRRDFTSKLETYCLGLGFKTIATGISGQHYHQDGNSIFRMLKTSRIYKWMRDFIGPSSGAAQSDEQTAHPFNVFEGNGYETAEKSYVLNAHSHPLPGARSQANQEFAG